MGLPDLYLGSEKIMGTTKDEAWSYIQLVFINKQKRWSLINANCTNYIAER